MHGIAGWFDISFLGTAEHVTLSTSPECPGTHWYQCRLMFQSPLAVNRGQYVSGNMRFTVHDEFSYYIDTTAQIDGTEIVTHSHVNLKDQVCMYVCIFAIY
jgi:type I protein arginine methyltransferase